MTSTSHLKLRILLVEDERAIREPSATTLSRAGYRVDAVESSEAGWERLQTHAYNLLITDNQMPGLSGLELVRRLRFAQMKLPVLFASGGIDDEELIGGDSLQPIAVLPKPFLTAELLDAVVKILPVTVQLQDVATLSSARIESYEHWGLNE